MGKYQRCEVLVDGEWIPGTLMSWRRGADGEWLAGVRYTRLVAPADLGGPVASSVTTPMPFTWERTMPRSAVRPAEGSPATPEG